MSHLDSDTNINHVVTLCHRFMLDTYKVNMESEVLVDMVRDAIKDLSQHSQYNTIEDANKAVILAIKDRVLNPHQAPISNEDDFFKKLQDLEAHRAVTRQTAPVQSPTPTPAPTPAAAVYNDKQSIVYLPSSAIPSRINKSVVIKGSDRMWEYFTKRSTLVWDGPIPHSSPNIRLEHVILPSECSTLTPVIHVNITGAAGNSFSCVCIRTQAAAAAAKWDTWTPCSSVMNIKALACPWTIKLTDNFGQALDMGDDGGIIASSVQLFNKNTKVTFLIPEHIRKGDLLLLKKTGSPEKIMKVINYDPDNISAELPSDNDLIGTRICNLHYQATIIISLLLD